ncbi:hypothetical protein ACODT5_28775 [Streptomyces sp. 5.8]|uniref:hypothetical protein n=1 Tax=Streptomyces sp. 5.8 TaxID=3406571 RepID=UPI003BB56552
MPRTRSPRRLHQLRRLRSKTLDRHTPLLDAAFAAIADHVGHDVMAAEIAMLDAHQRATEALRSLITGADPARHSLVLSTNLGGEHHVTGFELDTTTTAQVCAHHAPFGVFLGAALVTASRGGLVMRTIGEGDKETVRGWSLHDGALTPLTEEQVFSAYAVDHATGEPMPPQPDTTFAGGFPLRTW